MLGVGVVGAASVLKGSEPAVATCPSTTTVRVAAPAAVAPVIDDLTRSAEAGTCVDYVVATTSSYAVDRQLQAGGGQAPDVWISDSSLWVRDVGTALGDSALTTGPTVATSPVVVAVPKSLRGDSWASGSPTWTQLLNSTVPLNVRSPQSSSATVAALATANETIKSENDRVTYFLAMLRLTRGLLPDDVLNTRALAAKDVARAFTASEQEVAEFNQNYPNATLGAVVPAGGAAQLSYQVVYPKTGKPIPARARSLLESTLTSAQGKAALVAAGFRVPSSTKTPGGSPVPVQVALASEPSQKLTTSTIDAWNDLGRDDRMLVAVDGSGSMGDPVAANGASRMSLFQGLARLALATLPQTGQMGALGFSTAIPGGIKWFSDGVEPLAKDGVRSKLNKAVDGAMTYVDMNGDTPLYDATWTAYQYMTKTYDAKYVNAVVVLTDGKNDNPKGGLDLTGLLAKLKASYTKDKPIKIVTISLSRETDPDALRAISKTTGGLFYQVDKPEQITSVFIDAFLHR